MTKKPATAKEREYMGRVAALGCIVCGNPAQVHHIREGHGISQRASHYLTIPLCPEHHTNDPFSIHGAQQREFKNIHGDELHLLAQTIKLLHMRGRNPEHTAVALGDF